MATVLNTIYPPQAETFMPAFIYTKDAEIWFDVSLYTDIKKIKFIHISMVDQRNNQNVFAGIDSKGNTVYPQFYPIAFDPSLLYDNDKGLYKITISPRLLKTAPTFNIEQFYKVQLRFDLTETGTGEDGATSSEYLDDPTQFFFLDEDGTAKANAFGLTSYVNSNNSKFSEWSRGIIIKAIPKISLDLTFDQQEISTKEQESVKIFPSTDSTFLGNLTFLNDKEEYVDTAEYMTRYRAQVLDVNDLSNVFFDTDYIYTENNLNKNVFNTCIDTSKPVKNFDNIDEDKKYFLRLDYETSNNYHQTVNYSFQLKKYDDETNVDYTIEEDNDNGLIKIKINPKEYADGYIIVRRSDYYSSFKNWILIEAKKIVAGEVIEITDSTIESMTGYQYQVQYMDEEGKLSAPVRTQEIYSTDFYGALISRKDKKLKISFNLQLTNVSNPTIRTKTDTLGGRYPLFTQNAKLKYHTFSISGRISSQDDEAELFIKREEELGTDFYNHYYKKDCVTGEEKNYHSTVNLNYDWLWERIYRNKVEEWLNDGKPKLFRSMTEGNIIVIFDAVSLTPDTQLGRRLYTFSATMYEVGDGNDLDSLSSLGIIDVIDER